MALLGDHAFSGWWQGPCVEGGGFKAGCGLSSLLVALPGFAWPGS